MKIVKLSLLFSFLFLWSISLFSQKRIAEQPNSIEIKQDPLSDDTTNPVNNHIFISGEIDLEESNEHLWIPAHFIVIPFIDSKIIYHSVATSILSNSFRHYSQPSFRKSSQSYLKVFRI